MRRVLEWDVRLFPTVKSRPSGIGLLVKGNVAVDEAIFEGTYEGMRYEYPCLTVFECSHDRRIQCMRSFYDKLTIEQQVAKQYPGVKGWLFRKLINTSSRRESGGWRSPRPPEGRSQARPTSPQPSCDMDRPGFRRGPA